MINDEYRKTKAFQKAEYAYEFAKIFLILFWMPLFVLSVLYFMLQ